MRAVVVGFPKSGTTTLHFAIERSGLVSAHHMWNKRVVGAMVYKGWFEHGDPFALLGDVDVLTQMDACKPARGINYFPNLDIALLLAIRRQHPDCRFILTARDPAAVADSMLRWSDLSLRLADSAQPGLPDGRGRERADLERWITNHYAALRSIFAHDGCLIEIDVADPEAPAKLGAALGVEIKWWGRANENPKRRAAAA